MASRPKSQQKIELRLTNSQASPVRLVVEPWGEVFTIPAGATWELRGEGPAGDCLEVEFGDEEITVWGWTGSMVSILSEGREVTPAPVEGHAATTA